MEFPESCHPDTIRFYHYWLGKCGRRNMPRRADIDPVEMPRRLLPWISIVDVVEDARRYVYRLVGTGDVEVRGKDPTGRSVAEAYFGPSPEDALGCYDNVVATRAPLLDPTPFTAPDGKWVTDETLFLPLSDDGQHVNKILVFSYSRDIGILHRPLYS
jgi:hypothetical protein